VVVIAELLVNDYVKDPYGTHLQASVLTAGQTASQQDGSATALQEANNLMAAKVLRWPANRV